MTKTIGNTPAQAELDALCVNTLRFLAVDAVEKANSGHPGMPMGDAPMTHALWTHFLRHNPKNPGWPNRDRFVLSAGHGSMLLYSLLHLTGYALSLDELKKFRQWDSLTPGHPEHHPEIGIETTTGPLGQGFATGVGMAMAGQYLASRYNKPGFELFNYRVFGVTSDGDMMEGISNEAASIAGHLQLGSIVYLYSDNKITIEGSTDLSFTEDVGARFEALGWHVQKVNGNDITAVSSAISSGVAETKRPSLIIARTNIGFGSPGKQDSSEAHGAPLGKDEVKLAKEKLGWPLQPEFHIPDDALGFYRKAVANGEATQRAWDALFAAYAKEHAELAVELKSLINNEFGSAYFADLPVFSASDPAIATRSASGKVLNAIAAKTPFLIGGSADLAPSNNTYLKGQQNFLPGTPGRNLHFGVREHAMGALLNGMALSGMLVPYGGTFLVFSDYMRPAIRLAALMKLKVIYVFTHDSIGLGEDGPTHQPIEHLASLRAIPHLTVLRPADATETVEAWKLSLNRNALPGPVALILTRQNLPVLDRKKYAPAENLSKGAYVLADAAGKKVDVIIIATGSEVSVALGAYDKLTKDGINARVVSMPSMELFEAGSAEYKDSVLLPSVTARVAIEAGSPMGWHRYTGLKGAVIGIERFGASAPYKTIYEKFGLTIDNVVQKALSVISDNR